MIFPCARAWHVVRRLTCWVRLTGVLAWACGAAGTAAAPQIAPNTAMVPMDLAVEWVNHQQKQVYANPSWVQVSEPSDEGEVQIWQVLLQDKTLSQTLFRWAQTAGWQISWDAERDHPIEASIQIQATFVQALKMVMQSLADTEYPLQAVLNPHIRSMRVVRHNESPRR